MLAGIVEIGDQPAGGQVSTEITFADGRVILLEGVSATDVSAELFFCTTVSQTV